MLRIILFPAKKMEECPDLFPAESLPQFLEETILLHQKLKSMSESELQTLFKANDQITRQNFERFQYMDFRLSHTPALLSYVGIQYQSMAPKLFSWEQWSYVKEHLRILSGFYGVLRPQDGVLPYRLEMQAKLAMDRVDADHGTVEKSKDLYEFWGKRLLEGVVENPVPDTAEGSTVILNLASKEYSKAIEKHLTPDIRYVTCVFGVLDNGKVKVKATEAKMARGEMVRYMAEHQIENVDDIRQFAELGYRYSAELSSDDTFVYVKDKNTNRKSGGDHV